MCTAYIEHMLNCSTDNLKREDSLNDSRDQLKPLAVLVRCFDVSSWLASATSSRLGMQR
jgi:hypothetical protein